jgi:hypothetical protein
MPDFFCLYILDCWWRKQHVLPQVCSEFASWLEKGKKAFVAELLLPRESVFLSELKQLLLILIRVAISKSSFS